MGLLTLQNQIVVAAAVVVIVLLKAIVVLIAVVVVVVAVVAVVAVAASTTCGMTHTRWMRASTTFLPGFKPHTQNRISSGNFSSRKLCA